MRPVSHLTKINSGGFHYPSHKVKPYAAGDVVLIAEVHTRVISPQGSFRDTIPHRHKTLMGARLPVRGLAPQMFCDRWVNDM